MTETSLKIVSNLPQNSVTQNLWAPVYGEALLF